MVKVINIYKSQGITPFQLIQQVKKDRPELQDQKIGFAGRLDPLAHGVMVLLVGEENKNREQYLGLEKEYEFRVLFGVKTDSYDYLGLLESDFTLPPEDLRMKVDEFVRDYTGELILPYPPFSSKTVSGIPLYKLAKKNKLKETKLPERNVSITKFEVVGYEYKSAQELQKEILTNLRKIKGFFRQTKIIGGWKEFFQKYPDQEFVLAKFKITCSSGTYVRTLAYLLGEKLGSGAIAYEILRTRVGEYILDTFRKL